MKNQRTDARVSAKETCLFCRARRRKTKLTERLSAYGLKCDKAVIIYHAFGYEKGREPCEFSPCCM